MKFAYFVDALSLKYLNHKSHKDSILFLHHHHSLSFSPRQLQSMPYHCPIPDTAYTNIHSARSDGSSTAIRSSSTSSSTQHSLDRIAITEINMQVYLIKPQCVYAIHCMRRYGFGYEAMWGGDISFDLSVCSALYVYRTAYTHQRSRLDVCGLTFGMAGWGEACGYGNGMNRGNGTNSSQ